MIDFEILRQHGTTNERLKQVFTAERPAAFDTLEQEEKDRIEKDISLRKKVEDLIQTRLYDSIQFNLKNYELYSAVDLAWDSSPINKAAYPLMLYAQGKLKAGQCASSLEAAGFGSRYVSKNAETKEITIDVPKFYEVHVNLIRSIITRRLAAQSNKYANLWPYYKYESRSTGLVGKLRADVMSQRADIVADQFDYKHHEVQVAREMMLYGHVVDFVRCAWESEKQLRRKDQEAGLETSEATTESVITKEGVCFVNPHPSRVFWDNTYPLISLNTDTGCEWCGFWDVMRYRDVHGNPTYWNRDKVGYSTATATLFSTYQQYFGQYYTTVTPPAIRQDLTGSNDRLNNVGLYSAEEGDTAVILAHFFWKIVPSDWGIGSYPHPVWVRLDIAGDNSVMFAEILPSSPAAVASYNENDSRQVSISLAHELMGFQDQLTNLLSYLLLCLEADNIKVMVVNTDLATPENMRAFREKLKGSGAYTGTTVLEISFAKMEQLGISDPNKVISLVETKSSALDMIFRAIGQLIQMVERMAALSPQEQGQPAPREISATETNLIAGTTESVYGFISDAIDEYRAAKKRILYESIVALGDAQFEVPVVNRYPKSVIEAAGFQTGEGEFDHLPVEFAGQSRENGKPQRYTIIGTRNKLEHDYIFTSRDGAERPVNTQAANVLVQLLQSVVQMPPVLQALKKDQLYEVVNEIFRQSGAGYDLKLELEPGEDNALGPDPNDIMKKLSGILEQLTQASERNAQDIQAIKQAVEPMLKGQPPISTPPPQAQPMTQPMPMAA